MIKYTRCILMRMKYDPVFQIPCRRPSRLLVILSTWSHLSHPNILGASLRCIWLHLLRDILGVSRWVLPGNGPHWYLHLWVRPFLGHVLPPSTERSLEGLHSRSDDCSSSTRDLPSLSPDPSLDHQPDGGATPAAAAGC